MKQMKIWKLLHLQSFSYLEHDSYHFQRWIQEWQLLFLFFFLTHRDRNLFGVRKHQSGLFIFFCGCSYFPFFFFSSKIGCFWKYYSNKLIFFEQKKYLPQLFSRKEKNIPLQRGASIWKHVTEKIYRERIHGSPRGF